MSVNSQHPPDFTEDRYRSLILAARDRFQFCSLMDDLDADNIAIWRHDIDFSPHRGLAMARIEADAGVRSCFFVLLSSPFYNPFEAAVQEILRSIVALGHEVGLHYDASILTGGTREHETQIAFEATALARLVGTGVRSFSLHNPSVAPDVDLDTSHCAGLLNASWSALRSRFTYVSDSNGRWWYRSLHDVVADAATSRLYALTHPESWTPEPLGHHARIQRCIKGRASRVEDDYVALLRRHRPEALGDGA